MVVELNPELTGETEIELVADVTVDIKDPPVEVDQLQLVNALNVGLGANEFKGADVTVVAEGGNVLYEEVV